MGANGQIATTGTLTEGDTQWAAIATVGRVHILQQTTKGSLKVPRQADANSTIAIFRKDGKDVKAIAHYGPDKQKVWEIHTVPHGGINPHYHPWVDKHLL